MNAVGIDVSKGKSMVCVMRPFGEVVLEPFEVLHTAQNLNDLTGKLKALDGEPRVVLEATGNYHKPVAFVLHDAGLFVSVVNPVLIHDYDNNSLRRVKTDRKDAVIRIGSRYSVAVSSGFVTPISQVLLLDAFFFRYFCDRFIVRWKHSFEKYIL